MFKNRPSDHILGCLLNQTDLTKPDQVNGTHKIIQDVANSIINDKSKNIEILKTCPNINIMILLQAFYGITWDPEPWPLDRRLKNSTLCMAVQHASRVGGLCVQLGWWSQWRWMHQDILTLPAERILGAFDSVFETQNLPSSGQSAPSISELDLNHFPDIVTKLIWCGRLIHQLGSALRCYN